MVYYKPTKLLTHFTCSPQQLSPVLDCSYFNLHVRILPKFQTVAQALHSASSNFHAGSWLLDSGHAVVPSFTPPVQLDPSKITLFSSVNSRTPDQEPHTGLFYVGSKAKQTLSRCPPDLVSEFLPKLLKVVPTQATVERYPFPVRVLSHTSNGRARAEALVKKMKARYASAVLDISIFRVDSQIRDSHHTLLNTYPKGPVLVLDEDFEPNGEPDLLTYVPEYDQKYVHLWYVKNPLTELVYGHGGPKLMSLDSMDFSQAGLDMTTSCAQGVVLHDTCVGTHAFNTDAESTLRTAAREVYKLTLAKNNGDLESGQRLLSWLSAEPSVPGYHAVVTYATEAAESNSHLPINDYSLLKLEIDHVLHQTV